MPTFGDGEAGEQRQTMLGTRQFDKGITQSLLENYQPNRKSGTWLLHFWLDCNHCVDESSVSRVTTHIASCG
jgi:hypothetical protein